MTKKFLKENKLISKSQKRLRSKKHNAFTEEVHKIALSANDNEKIQSADSIEAYAYGTSKYIIRKNEKIRFKMQKPKHKSD